jgi:hypothetical protein
VASGPVGAHANAKISTTMIYKTPHCASIGSKQSIIGISISKAARYHNNINVVKENVFYFMLAENFEVKVIAQGMHDAIAALY